VCEGALLCLTVETRLGSSLESNMSTDMKTPIDVLLLLVLILQNVGASIIYIHIYSKLQMMTSLSLVADAVGRRLSAYAGRKIGSLQLQTALIYEENFKK
jgi:hypothetical protein